MVSEDDNAVDAEGATRPGDRLRAAREALKLDLAEIATRTRVTLRHLQLLEDNDFAGLPGPTYSIGFARAYARAVGLDDAAIAAAVRAELAMTGDGPNHYEMFEPADPARVPPRILAWTAAIVALLIAVGYGIWRVQFFSPPAVVEGQPGAAPAPGGKNAAVPIGSTAQPVVLTARESVWLRISDEDGNRLFEKEMPKGETYTVPADAHNPMILTGRPDMLAVTVGGRAVPPLGQGDRTVADLPISAAALLARPPRPSSPTPARPRSSSPQPSLAPPPQPPSSQPAPPPAAPLSPPPANPPPAQE